jgi:hypothetical protein
MGVLCSVIFTINGPVLIYVKTDNSGNIEPLLTFGAQRSYIVAGISIVYLLFGKKGRL